MTHSLNQQQLDQFEQAGYVLCPDLLDDEVSEMQEAMPAILARPGPEIVREPTDPTAVRLAFAAHETNKTFRRLACDPRLLEPVRQILQDDVYLHQSRLNPKPPFGNGTAWPWHQDYPPWHLIDGMPEPRCVMASIFIDPCLPANSPLLVLPGSHHFGTFESSLHEDAAGRGYDLHNMQPETIATLAEEHGIDALIGPAGSVAFVHCNLVHGSANNVSPWRRAILYLIYNAVSNACTKATRPSYQNNRDFTPLQASS